MTIRTNPQSGLAGGALPAFADTGREAAIHPAAIGRALALSLLENLSFLDRLPLDGEARYRAARALWSGFVQTLLPAIDAGPDDFDAAWLSRWLDDTASDLLDGAALALLAAEPLASADVDQGDDA
ncbi:hypothetical protein [Crenobacter luteus]|uniref:Uncharacterized protein n=1 Tax=Crenobacter luteus TaxID=1452487 RepID=A0A165EKZ5_9NEIS|nr:hypothetical protein [Crenobacter luteus]KZE25328.1 hypothetical protein AVW16_03235 [Crenobacter luteus]